MFRGWKIVSLAFAGLLFFTAAAQAQSKTCHALDFASPSNDPAAGDGFGKIVTASNAAGSAVFAFAFYGLKPRTTYVITVNTGSEVTVGQFTTNKFGIGAFRPKKLNITVPNDFSAACLYEGSTTGPVVLKAQRGGPAGSITTRTLTRS